ncbi:hypothetical protein GCM10011514_01490 [Emticicia aquatilis]|uniref:DoxX family protein n=1 Tax=Emticicia aquatilis TaxID=1537369 RepID=A0A916YE82_9BACT|nr:hypothetical protein [Emticicia aquatilis]GGD41112.1 hypothetical protein GCM10011514_01490 [Emticicia aquatilis]
MASNYKQLNPLSISSNIIWWNRVALFVVFFWFGFLKIIHISPAEGLVTNLHQATIASLMPIEHFLVFLGVVECVIGVLWLIPSLTKVAFGVFILQMFTTFLPLLFLPKDTWQNTLVLTLTGQYIIKNVVLIASALTILRATSKVETNEVIVRKSPSLT